MKVSHWIQYMFPTRRRTKSKKIIPLLLLKFLISFVYCILTSIKDTVIVTAACSGAEVIPIIKGFIIFPIAILVVIGYAKLNNVIKRNTIFYGTIVVFLLLIGLYGFYLYPNSHTLSPHTTADWLTNYFGTKYIYFVAVYRYWMHVFFFVMAEVWGQVVMIMLYWTFVNHICTIKEAKRIYVILIAAGNLAQIAAGFIVPIHISQYGKANLVHVVQILMSYSLVAGILIVGIYWWLNRFISNNNYTAATMAKTQLSLWESIKQISSSRYLLSVSTMMIGCGFAMNIVDITWKSYLKESASMPADFQMFTSYMNVIIGTSSFIISVFFGRRLLNKFGWNICARIAPIAMGVSGVLFFLMSYFKAYLNPIAALLGTNVLLLIVFFGAFQSVITKVVKYAFFDTTKEMAYIPLGQELKIKGKAAIDMVGSRMGKSSSSWLHSLLIGLTGSVQSCSGLLLIVLAIVTYIWYRSTQYIHSKLEVK